MSGRITYRTKQKRKYGTGTGADYKPFITDREFNSLGTTSVIKDWKTGRSVHCLSQAEAYWYYLLRWSDDNADIREQFPLDNSDTVRIAEMYYIKHPRNNHNIMTTDFLVTKTDGSEIAYSVKSNRNLGRRTLEKLCIEKRYWLERGAGFEVIFKTDVNPVEVTNIRLAVEFYDIADVFDRYSLIKHLIAHKQIAVNMGEKILDIETLDRLAGTAV